MDPINIIGIIIITGIFGGIINYFRNVFEKKLEAILLIKSILIGLAASALVPLFLNMISSDLLTTKDNLPTNYFIFLGFCLIAAIFSGEFIESIGKKVLNQIGEVKKEMEENNTENEMPELIDYEKREDLSESQKKILSAFISSKFTFRSISGLSKQTDLDKATVKKELVELQHLGLTEVVERQKGPRWKITSEGYKR